MISIVYVDFAKLVFVPVYPDTGISDFIILYYYHYYYLAVRSGNKYNNHNKIQNK